MKKTILIGSGGHAKSLLSMIDNDSLFEGYCDIQESKEFRLNYLGTDDCIIDRFSQDEYYVHCAVVYGKDFNLDLRKKILDKYKYFEKTTFVAKSAIVNESAIIGDGVEVFEGCILGSVQISADSIVNTGTIIEHDVIIGENVFIGPGSIICGGVRISSNVMIGAGVRIKDDVFVCEDAIIGIGSVVIKDIIEPGTYVGNPCRKIK